MSPTVDEKAKSDLIMSKHIRQATCKILQRPSQFNGFSANKNIFRYEERFFLLNDMIFHQRGAGEINRTRKTQNIK